jgi:predicted transcriptional regulator of viral defense system
MRQDARLAASSLEKIGELFKLNTGEYSLMKAKQE